MLEVIRAFAAANLEVGTIRRVSALQRSLRSSPEVPAAPIAWVASPNLHIALHAFGEIDHALAPALGDALSDIVEGYPPIRIQLGGVSAFPRNEHARLLFIDAHDVSGALERLAGQIEQLAQSFGLPSRAHPFHSHLMLGRMAEPVDVTRWFASLGRAELPDSQLTECVLYEDRIDKRGAEYGALRRISLKLAAGGRSNRPRSRHPSQRPKSRSKPPPSARAPKPDAIPPPPKVPDFNDGEQ